MNSPRQIRVIWPESTAELRLPNFDISVSASFADRLARAGHPLNTRCGRQGLCGGCTVQLVAGTFRQHDGIVVFAPMEVKACQGDVPNGAAAVVAIPSRSMVVHRPQVVTTFKVRVPATQQPIVPVVPGVRDHGFAIDVGTTTVVVALVDLVSGQIVAEESAFNRQIELGDNVVTRIQLAGAPSEREALRQAIVTETLAPLTSAACARAGIEAGRIAGATIAGNTTMLHLLTGTDPSSMGVAPFTAAFTDHRVLTAAELHLATVPADTPVHLLPGFSSYVGADLVAGTLCSGLLHDPGPTMLVDVGTNGEILLRHGDRLFATATAAGPAFEGGSVTRGTRAIPGAISRVTFPKKEFPPRLEIIPGARKPVGLCGSAYIDFLAQARALRLLNVHGRFQQTAWRRLSPAHRYHYGLDRAIQLRANDPSSMITERDVAQLLQAKAAIAAGILTLLRRAELTPAKIKRLYLAGGFGMHVNVAHAIACGLLPRFTPEQVEVVGNTSLGGAWLALNDQTILPEMTRVSRTAEIVELNLEPRFEDTFIDQLALP